AAMVVAVPLAQGDLPNSVANLHWPALYALFWVLLWTPATLAGRVVAVGTTVLLALSDVLLVARLPLAVARLVVRRDRYRALLAGAGRAVRGAAVGPGHPRRPGRGGGHHGAGRVERRPGGGPAPAGGGATGGAARPVPRAAGGGAVRRARRPGGGAAGRHRRPRDRRRPGAGGYRLPAAGGAVGGDGFAGAGHRSALRAVAG